MLYSGLKNAMNKGKRAVRKQYTSELTQLTVIEIVTKLSEKKRNFSFRDIEEEYQQPLSAADKF